MPAILGTALVPEYPRGDSELSIAAERVEEQSSESVESYRRQTHAEYSLLAPLEVQAADVVIPSERVRHEIAVIEPPRLVQLPGVDDETVAEFVGHVGEGIVAAAFAEIDGDIRDEGILERIKGDVKRTFLRSPSSYSYIRFRSRNRLREKF